MKVMMIEPLGDGGITHYALNLLRALTSDRLLPVLFTSRTYEFREQSMPFTVYPRMFKLASVLGVIFPWITRETRFPSLLRRALKVFEYPINVLEAIVVSRKERAAVVHVQSVNAIELIMVVAFKAFGTPVVYTIHNVRPLHHELKAHHRMIYRLLYALCDHLIIHSEEGKREIIDLFSVKSEKITVIPHGDYKFFLPGEVVAVRDAKQALGIPDTAPTVLFFGAIRPNKGLDLLLAAIGRIKEDVPEIKLLIVGEPCEDYARYRAIIARERIEPHVIERLEYVPHEDVWRYFIAADVVVLPYREITQSGVLQIAYAFGRPVIATAIGGFNESIENGKNGYLIPPFEVDVMAQRIREIVSKRDLMAEMGRYSRFLSDTVYSWEAIAERTSEIYAKIMPTPAG